MLDVRVDVDPSEFCVTRYTVVSVHWPLSAMESVSDVSAHTSVVVCSAGTGNGLELMAARLKRPVTFASEGPSWNGSLFDPWHAARIARPASQPHRHVQPLRLMLIPHDLIGARGGT